MSINPTSSPTTLEQQNIDLLQKLLKCPSITPNSHGSLEIVKDFLLELNFSVEVIEFKHKDTYPVKNLYAEIGEGRNTLAFCGHLDVVPPGDISKWSVPPFSGRIVGEDIISRGSEDMKGSIACFLTAVKAFIKDPSYNSKIGKVAILITLDEEGLAINGVQKLIKYVTKHKNQSISACLVGEPTCNQVLGDTVKVGRRGSLNFEITTIGKQGHVAYPKLAKNSVKLANSIITDLYKIKFDKICDPNFDQSNLEVISVNSHNETFNMIPGQTTIKGNIRYNNSYTLNEVKNSITQATLFHDSNAIINFLADASSPFITSENSKVCLSMQQAIANIAGIKAKTNTSGGTSDARYIKNYCDVIEFGFIEKTLHQINEKVSMKDIYLLIKIYMNFLALYFKEN